MFSANQGARLKNGKELNFNSILEDPTKLRKDRHNQSFSDSTTILEQRSFLLLMQ
jgi:hypothetical protein